MQHPIRSDDAMAPARDTYTRRQAGALMLALAALTGVPVVARAAATAPAMFGPPRPFRPEQLVAMAKALAAKPFAPRPMPASAAANYDAHVKLAYGQAAELPGHIRLFPARRDIGAEAVGIHIVANGQARTLTDTHGLFGGGGAVDPAGFRVMFPDGHADWLAFLGASYFRASGRLGQFGLSARGIAVDTGIDHSEEFPAFTDFWIEAIGEDRLLIHALLDGPSLTGAYTIDTTRKPDGAVQDITATVFLRRDIRRLGFAAMSSMYVAGEDGQGQRLDWRPEVHDSDGLSIVDGNRERIWRPLDNPPDSPRTNAYHVDGMKGFGLLQRDQNFDHYQDDNSFFDRRPSLWVEPKGDWGAGAVMLFAFPSISENVDNIACFFVTDQAAKAGQRRDMAYRLTWGSTVPDGDDNAICTAVRMGPGGVPGADPISGATRYVFEFTGKSLAGLGRDSGVVAITNLPKDAVLLNASGPINTRDAMWRVVLDVRTQGLAQDNFRVFLQRAGGAISETVIKSVKP